MHPTAAPERIPTEHAPGSATTDHVTPTHCPYCALQCGMGLVRGAGGVEVVERPAFPVNGGALCGKGRTAPAVLSSRVRLTEPLAWANTNPR
mgnify:FL=1